MANIMIIEPHALLRLGLEQLLAGLGPNVTLTSQDDPANAPGDIPRKHIDLVLLSLCRPEVSERHIDTVEHTFGPTSIVAMGDEKMMPAPFSELSDRLAGYIPKSCAPEMLQAAIRLVLAGGTCFPKAPSAPAKAQALPQQASAPRNHTLPSAPPGETLNGFESDTLMKPYTPPRWPPVAESHSHKAPPKKEMAEHELLGLTPRQYEVLVLLARGYPMKTVGRYLNISVATAKAHTETLYQRLDVHNRNAAVYAAVSRGAKLGWKCIGGETDSASTKQHC